VNTVQHEPPTGLDLSSDIAPLVAGERLTRAEFERRFDAMPGLKKAELLEGVVYMPSPVRFLAHGQPHSMILGWLFHYQAATPTVRAFADCTIRLDDVNEPQPDAGLFLDPAAGGRVRLSNDDYIEGAPELVVEVAGSTASIDLRVKLPIYRRHGVKEYLVWRVEDRAIDWFVLRDNEYELLPPSLRGFYESTVFPGLWLDPAALLQLDSARVLQTLQFGLASPEHADFLAAHREREAAGPDPANAEPA
jgi:Uma2 family endonuclease